jgi:NADH:ubiquinone oxidoreductase subunit K
MEYYLILSAILFCIGIWGVLKSRNAIVVFMAIELMLNAVNLTLITFSSHMNIILSRFVSIIPSDQLQETIKIATSSGQVFVFLVMTVAAAEAAVGLAIIISIQKLKDSVNVDDVNIMKW